MDSIEQAFPEIKCTGFVQPLNSFENRVFKVSVEGGDPVVAKFYRPGKWGPEKIIEEHKLLLDLAHAGQKVTPPKVSSSGETLFRAGGLHLGLFEFSRGRWVDELLLSDYFSLGTQLAEIHRVGDLTVKNRTSRPLVRVQSLQEDVQLVERFCPPQFIGRYLELFDELMGTLINEELELGGHFLHGDFHRGNLLRDSKGSFVILDFDDFSFGPRVQDFWLIAGDSPVARDELIRGYTEILHWNDKEWRLVPLLQAHRIVAYTLWVLKRWQDPLFPQTFPQMLLEKSWFEEVQKLDECLEIFSKNP